MQVKINEVNKTVYLVSDEGRLHRDINSSFFASLTKKINISDYKVFLVDPKEGIDFYKSNFQSLLKENLEKCFLVNSFSNYKDMFKLVESQVEENFYYSGSPLLTIQWVYKDSKNFLDTNIDFTPADFSKRILYLNRTLRPGRLLLFNYLDSRLDLSNFVFSTPFDLSKKQQNYFQNECKFNKTKFLSEHLSDVGLQFIPDMIAGWETNSVANVNDVAHLSVYRNRAKFENWPQLNLYKNIFLEIVSESFGDGILASNTFRKTGLIITEKTIKPMIALRPFLVNANVGFLQSLKDLGFITYSKWFDESYDFEHNIHKKFEILYKNINLILSYSEKQLYELYRDMTPTLIHNKELAISLMKRDYIIENNEFIKKTVK